MAKSWLTHQTAPNKRKNFCLVALPRFLKVHTKDRLQIHSFLSNSKLEMYGDEITRTAQMHQYVLGLLFSIDKENKLEKVSNAYTEPSALVLFSLLA